MTYTVTDAMRDFSADIRSRYFPACPTLADGPEVYDAFREAVRRSKWVLECRRRLQEPQYDYPPVPPSDAPADWLAVAEDVADTFAHYLSLV